MFSTARRLIKTGIGFLVAGLLLGGYLLIRREIFHQWAPPRLASAHAHAVWVGFVMFMILGVALWLFPRAPKDDRRYRPSWIEASYWILLVSTAIRFVTEVPGTTMTLSAGSSWPAAWGRLSGYCSTSGPCGHAFDRSAVVSANSQAKDSDRNANAAGRWTRAKH